MKTTYDKKDIERLINRLNEGVEMERYGDMEYDIFSANEKMKEAAIALNQLLDEQKL
jgi:hypothetical protein